MARSFCPPQNPDAPLRLIRGGPERLEGCDSQIESSGGEKGRGSSFYFPAVTARPAEVHRISLATCLRVTATPGKDGGLLHHGLLRSPRPPPVVTTKMATDASNQKDAGLGNTGSKLHAQQDPQKQSRIPRGLCPKDPRQVKKPEGGRARAPEKRGHSARGDGCIRTLTRGALLSTRNRRRHEGQAANTKRVLPKAAGCLQVWRGARRAPLSYEGSST